MGEVKRIFNQAKIDRDTDARMVQPGFHRDALNVSVGESEGGDVGAVENLKGNEEIAGQTSIEGTTIGSVRDPNNNKIYWFNKGATTDAIYEYDEQTGDVNTILKDKVSRPLIKPKCAPDFKVFLDPVPDDTANRSGLNITFTDPLPGCTTVGQFNYDPNAEYNDGSCIPFIYGCTDVNANNYEASANTDDGSCSYTSTIGVTISGDGSFYNSSSPVTLTANATNANGAFTYLWSTGETTQTISVSGSSNTITGSVTVTDSYGSATDSYSVSFAASAPTTYTKTLTVNNNVSGMSNGQVTGDPHGAQRSGASGTSWSFTTGISANSGYSYSGNAPVTQQGTHTNNSGVTTTLTGSITANPPNTCTATLTQVINGVTNGGINASYFTLTTAPVSANATCTNSLNALTVFPVTYALTSAGIAAGYSYSPATSTYTGNGGTYQTSSAVVGTANGTVTFTQPTHTLNITNGSSGLGSNITVSSNSYTRVQNVGIGTTVHYTVTCSPGTGYQWVQLPTVSASGLPSGVVLGATSGASVGGTGARQVSIASNWQPASAGTTNASITWTGGSVQAIPARRSTSISSYGGVTTSAQCASRSMPVTVYFSDTTSPYTGIQNGDTLYTSATGTGVYSSGSGYKTNVANGYGTALGTITISNGVVSNSNTSFC